MPVAVLHDDVDDALSFLIVGDNVQFLDRNIALGEVEL